MMSYGFAITADVIIYADFRSASIPTMTVITEIDGDVQHQEVVANNDMPRCGRRRRNDICDAFLFGNYNPVCGAAVLVAHQLGGAGLVMLALATGKLKFPVALTSVQPLYCGRSAHPTPISSPPPLHSTAQLRCAGMSL